MYPEAKILKLAGDCIFGSESMCSVDSAVGAALVAGYRVGSILVLSRNCDATPQGGNSSIRMAG
ncbi:hypothetical protein EGJ56_25520 [Pandoraea apista]|nr:hypothetical protein EGJ56_25520 [Pandoraea apista]